MICLHHNDMDGDCSGAIVHDFHKEKGEKVRFHSCNHNLPIPFELIKEDEQVYMVDFSLSEEDFDKLLSITKNVIWIDHHKSAMEKFKGTEVEKLEGIRRIGDSGCELTWEYFYGSGKRVKVPTVVRMLGRYDVWDFSLYGKNKLHALQEYCKTVDTSPSSKVWEKWLDTEYSPKEEVEIGIIYLKYRDSVWSYFLSSWGIEIEFEGYWTMACNTANVGSEFFKTVHDKGYDLFMPFIYDGKQWVCSLYTLKDSIDCSKIATKYGGGGHKKAAGFSADELPFLKK